MIQPSQTWHWLLNGLNGLIDMMQANKVGMNEDQRNRLRDMIGRLQSLLNTLENWKED